jgi:5-methylcytosine-specific restriction endonuclease McrA
MPIRPENRARYPADWPEISRSIRFDRALGRCECDGRCGHDCAPRCLAIHGEHHPITGAVVVLTVAHLDHQPEHNDPANLIAACQRCHNSYDAPMRRAGRMARERSARALGDLFD